MEIGEKLSARTALMGLAFVLTACSRRASKVGMGGRASKVAWDGMWGWGFVYGWGER